MTNEATEVVAVPAGWEIYDFNKTILETKAGRENQINASEIKPIGQCPVIDQGKSYIAGYSDKVEKLYTPESPVVVFGDHTRIFKYVDFPFIIGADGTKILRPDPNLFNPKFYYFYLLSLSIPSRGYNRHYSILKEKKILRPPKPEQDAIAHIFSVIEKFIDVHSAIADRGFELRKTLLHQVMTGITRTHDLNLDKTILKNK